MKPLRILVLLLGASAPLYAQIADVSQLSATIQNANVDSTAKTERLAAIFFHEKINQYRVSLKKPALGWDDTLWLAAWNHDNWMMRNENLAHEEIKGTNLFTGVEPGDRYAYASNHKGSCDWSGENVLYNYSSSFTDCAKNALAIADYSFQQWKNSPGHNANMINPDSRVHGVAFRIADDGRVWATELLAYSPSYSPIVAKPAPLYSKNKIEYVYNAVDTPYVDNTPIKATAETVTKQEDKQGKFVSASTKYVRLDLTETSDDLENALYGSSTAHQSKAMARAAQRHANYMAANSKVTHEERKKKRKYYGGSPQKRIAKASRGAKLFHKSSTHYVESIAFVTADAATLDVNELAKKIAAALDKERTVTTAGTTATAVGFGVMIKRSRNELKIYVVREERMQKAASTSDDY